MTDEELRVADGSDEAALAGGAEGPHGAVVPLPAGGAAADAEAATSPSVLAGIGAEAAFDAADDESARPPSVLAGIGAEAPQPAHPSASTADVLALIDRLEDLLERSDLAELEVEAGEFGILLRKPGQYVSTLPVLPAAPAGNPAPAGAGTTAAAASAAAPGGHPPEPHHHRVLAPLTGIYYGAPSPGAAPYLKVGGEVAAGQVIGLIEAMKLFNEIKSDVSGRVVRIHAENGKLVKARQPLIEIEPS